jgi:hypothetical protein
MIERTFDAIWFNNLCNLPEVRPGLGGEGPIDVTPTLGDPANYALRSAHGGFILINYGAGVYGVHTQFAAKGRGQHAIAAMRAGLEWMFTRTDCKMIHSHCPDDNPAALKLAQVGGASMWFHNDVNGLGPGHVVRWDLLDWVVSNKDLEPEGQAFHTLLDEAKAAKGSELPQHKDDRCHDRAVGAAILMCKRGQPQKGVDAYNAWAAGAAYAPIKLVSEAPPLVDVVDGVVGLDNAGELEVLIVREA